MHSLQGKILIGTQSSEIVEIDPETSQAQVTRGLNPTLCSFNLPSLLHDHHSPFPHPIPLLFYPLISLSIPPFPRPISLLSYTIITLSILPFPHSIPLLFYPLISPNLTLSSSNLPSLLHYHHSLNPALSSFNPPSLLPSHLSQSYPFLVQSPFSFTLSSFSQSCPFLIQSHFSFTLSSLLPLFLISLHFSSLPPPSLPYPLFPLLHFSSFSSSPLFLLSSISLLFLIFYLFSQVIMHAHAEGELWGMAVHPQSHDFVTASCDKTICSWSLSDKVQYIYVVMKGTEKMFFNRLLIIHISYL